MKNVVSKLTVLAFALAIVAGVAFKSEDPDPSLKVFANVDGEWEDITGQEYDCEASPEICIAQFRNDNTHGQMLYSEPGDYQP